MSPILEKWVQYKRCSKVIEGTRIICFKVPLNRSIQRKNQVKKIWDIQTLLRAIPKLGAVIDLTNSTQYYDPKELLIRKVSYKKIMMPGDELPPDRKVIAFQNALEEYLKQKEDSLIGVHCVHGLNRTGYMVCRYMRDRLNIPAAEAIKKFEKARGYKMQKKNYIEDLLSNRPARPDEGHYATATSSSSATTQPTSSASATTQATSSSSATTQPTSSASATTQPTSSATHTETSSSTSAKTD